MNKNSFIVLFLAFVLVFISLPQIQKVKAQSTIYIRDDGTIEGTDKLEKDGVLNRFVLLDNIVGRSIVIERTMGTFDGNGFTIEGYGNGTGIYLAGRGTIENVTVKGFSTGISVFGDNHKVANCLVTGNDVGLSTTQNSYRIKNSIITGNNITKNKLGLRIEMGYRDDETDLVIVGNWISENNVGIFFTLNRGATLATFDFHMNVQIYKNSFVKNNKTANYGVYFTMVYPSMSSDYTNIWDNGEEGNYWSFYNGTDANNDGIIDEPLELAGENIDNYPLTEPIEIQTIPEFHSLTILSLIGLVLSVVIVFRRPYIKH